ncbi:hypothetical protein BSY239_1060 [Hydrogenophaga sp. RAC07]|uniref:hypothetical protein n=1 Tax=Hydrogenophaga sp. RAC07 TaxID=1842537 RepID=UPI0008584D7D|nr:hypothetical protein [Hydrogenophaga sp. RAC07]AOF84165.1 hypothetical protein BSY239_1060 [Hydrogenophaga sp. RAC07]
MHPTQRYLLPLLLVLLVGLTWLQPLDQLAQAHSEAGLKRSLAAFAAARGFNAVISVIQGTEVTGGAFVNVTLALGQVLDPVNDLIEQFARLMLVVSVVFGAQLLLLKMGATWGVSLVLTALVAVWLWQRWRLERPSPWLGRLLVALLLVRFVVPVAAVTSELSYQAFMSEQFAVSQQAIASSTAALGGGGSGADSTKRWWELREKLAEKIDELRADADRVVAHVIDLIVLFVMQTVVLPLLVLMAAWWLWRASFDGLRHRRPM